MTSDPEKNQFILSEPGVWATKTFTTMLAYREHYFDVNSFAKRHACFAMQVK
jgi:hypothetical protein